MFQSQDSQYQRLKDIQKSNQHVKNLIDSAKKMIYNQNNMSATEKQILQVKISIEKDHLKNTFYKIDCPQNSFNLQIVNKNPQKFSSAFSKPVTFNQQKNTFKLQTTSQYNEQNQNSFQQTRILISRIVQKDQSSNPYKKQNYPQSTKQPQFSETYKNRNQSARTYTIEQPQRNTKIVIKTKQESYYPYNRFNMTQKFSRPQEQNNSKGPSFSSSPKTQKFQVKQFSNVEPYFEQEISLSTPQRTYKIKNTQTGENIPKQKSQLSTGRNIKNQHKNERFYDHSQKYSEKSTSYKEILQKNKEKLQDSRQKSIHSHSKSPSYKLNLEKLLEKKQQGKKRLYGQSYESTYRQTNIGSGSKVKYSIANSQKSNKQAGYKIKNGDITGREKSQSSRQHSLSHQKSKALHSTTIKGLHLPCSSPCTKCKSKTNRPKQKQQPLSSYHLAKKYLTPQGEQECYNFLRSQGIQEKDWPIFITQYVYRQLSKAYNEVSPNRTQQTH